MNGLLIIDKPLRMTSAQAVAIVRRLAGDVKTGHAGTLDPLATGVLVLALGTATKSIERLMATEKRYRTEIDLSAFTMTDDVEGERTDVAVHEELRPTEDAIRAVIASRFTGEIMQKPPAFSAVKIEGRRAYDIARSGGTPMIAPRCVVVHEIGLCAYRWPIAEIDIRCGKGFYVRSFARNLGEALGVGGHCTSIRRTAVGAYTIDMAKTLEQLPDPLTQRDLLPMSSIGADASQ